MANVDPVKELIVDPLAWLLAVPAFVAGWFGLGPVLQFVVDTSSLWFPAIAIGGTSFLPELPAVTPSLADTIVIAATIGYVSILVGKLLNRGVDRYKGK